MNKELIEKMNKIFSKDMGAQEAAEFFGNLNIEEYDQLTKMLEGINIPGVNDTTKDKALTIIRSLRDGLHKKIKDEKGVDYDEVKNS